MQSAYAVYGSKLHLVLDDDFAETWNRAQQKFFEAQTKHKKRTGHEWDALNELLTVEWDQEEQDAFNKFSGFMNTYIEFLGGSLDLAVGEFPSDFLVKLDDQREYEGGEIRWFIQVETPKLRVV